MPLDLELTELSVAVWFMDDGRMVHSRKTGIISTDGFTYEECERLSDKLSEFGIKCGVTKTEVGNLHQQTQLHKNL